VEDLDGIVIPLPGEGYADIAEDETAAVEECKAEAVECAPDIAGEQEGGADEEQIEVIARMKLEEIKKVRAEAKEKQRCVEVINLDDPDASLSKTDTVQAKENLECDEKHQEVHFDQDHLVDKEVEEVTSSLEKQNSLENIANEKTFISIEPDTNNKNGDGGDKESDLTKLYDDQELVNNDTVDREKKELEKDKKVEVEDGVEGGGGGPREATPLRLVSLATLVPSSPPHQGGGASLPGWTTAEGSPPPRPPTPPLTAADVVANTPIPQGTVTPVAPGTKLVSSSVLRMSSAMTGLPPGVYMLVRPTGAQAVLIVKAEAEDSTTSLDPPPAPAPVPSPSTSSKTCYGTVKQSKPAQAHSYRTPLQLFTEEQALGSSSSSSSSSSTLDRSMMEQWHRMSEVEKDVYRVKASQQVASVSEPRGISLPARPEVAPMFRDPSLPQGWTRQLVLRTRGNTAGKYDVYIYTPDGAKLRSVNEVRSYLSRRGLTGIQPEHISFRVGGPPGRSGGAGPGDEARQAPLGAASKAGVEGGLGGLLEDSDDEWVPGMMNN